MVVAAVKPFIHPQDGLLNTLGLVKPAKRREHFSAVSRRGSDGLIVPQSRKEFLYFRQQLQRGRIVALEFCNHAKEAQRDPSEALVSRLRRPLSRLLGEGLGFVEMKLSDEMCCQIGQTKSQQSWFPAFPVTCERRLISASRFIDSAQHLEAVCKIAEESIARVLVLRRFREIDCSIEPANRFFVLSQTGEQEAESVGGNRFE